MVTRRKILAMAVQTFAAIVRRLLLRRRFGMRIVTAAAPHLVSRPALALAQRQRLNLTERPGCLGLITAEHEIMDVIRKPISRLKLIDAPPRLIDRNSPLEMTLHADRVPPIGRQLCGIHDR